MANTQRHYCHNVTGWCTLVPVCREATDFPIGKWPHISCNENAYVLDIAVALELDCGNWDAKLFVNIVWPFSVFFTGTVDFRRELWWFCKCACVSLFFSQFVDIFCALSATLSLFVSTCKMLPHKRLTSGGDIFYANFELKVTLHHAGCCSASVMYQSVWYCVTAF